MPIDRALTPQEVQTAQQQAQAIASTAQPVIRPGQFVFFAGFDGTRNDRDNLSLSGTSQPTNVAELELQVGLTQASNPNVRSRYYSGPGTADSLVASAFDPPQVTQEVINIAQRAYNDFAREAKTWLESNPGGSVTSMVTAFSRGGAPAVIFSQLLYEKGLVTSDGVQLIPPGQVGVSGGVMFDPVFTGVQGNLAFAPNVTNIVVIRAQDEFRTFFPAADLGAHPGVSVRDLLGNHGDGGGFQDNGLSSLSLGAGTLFLRGSGLSITDVRPGRQFDPNAPVYLHTDAFDENGNRLWEETGSRGNRSTVQVAESPTVVEHADGTSLVTFKDIRGNVVHTLLDFDGRVINSTTVVSATTKLASEAFAQTIGDVTSLVNAIKAGQPLPVLNSGLRLVNNLDQLDSTRVPLLNTTATVVGGLASFASLHDAFGGGGSDLGKLNATLSTVNYVNSSVPLFLSGNAATQPVNQALSEALNGSTNGLLGQAGGSLGVLPAIGLISALKNNDPIGVATSLGTLLQGSAFLISNPIGWVLLAASFYKALQEPPEAWGVGGYRFGAGTELVLDAHGESFGIERVRQLQLAVQDYLEQTIAASTQGRPDVPLGIVPQRMPTLTWREARQDDPGYAVRAIDPLTGEERYPHLRYNDDYTPYNADASDPEQRRSLFERLLLAALQRGALAPLWEVQTAKLQQDVGDPLAGLTEEERAARRGLLAAVDATTNRHIPGEFRPIALDLDGDGRISTVANAGTERAFNWDGSGFDKQVGWVGMSEGLLWLDRNPNGVVDSGKELFSNSVLADAAKGTRSLVAVDANQDGVINGLDPVFNKLRVWQDADGDAQLDAGESKRLAELGISELDYGSSRFTRDGQLRSMQTAVLEASSEGQRASIVPEGIRVEFTDGRATLFVTRVADLGAGNDGVDALEDGGQDYDAQGQPLGQVPGRHDPVSIPTALLLANDQIGASNAGLVISAVGNASVGSVSLNAQTGVVEFLAPHHFNGVASFDYTVSAPDGQSKLATVTVNVAPVNDRPDVQAVLPDRAIYGWGVLVQRDLVFIGGEPQQQVTISPEQGEAFYAPFGTVQGQQYEQVMVGIDVEWRPVGDLVDTGIPQNYFDAEYARATAADEFGREPAFLAVQWNGRTFRVAASPSTYLHDTIVAYESGNDGRVVATDVDGGGLVRYEVHSQPLYGRLGADGADDDIDPNTGAFTYEGRRYVEFDEGGYRIDQNVFSDKHARNEWDGDPADIANYDSFTVKVIDLNDPSGNTFTLRDVRVPHFGPLPNPTVQSGAKKPIAIDLNGDGFYFTDVDDSNVFFDVNGDGWRRRIAWNNPQDGFIAYDKNGDGRITDFDELSFVPHDTSGRTDLEALRGAFDSNGDGIFSAADERWNSFGVWRDADADGVSDAGEFRSLADLGIAQVALASDGQFRVADGQTVHGTALASRTDGSTLAIADVTLRYRNETRVATPGGGTATVPVPTVQPGTVFDGTADPDLVLGTTGSDMFRTGDGNDVVNDDFGNDGVQAGAGDDLIYTGADNDVIDGGTGNDTVFAGVGNDLVFGDDGDDLLMLEGGSDVAFGGAGQDFIAGGAGNDAISGDAGDDKLFGEGGWDALFGKDGDDELWGLDGNDLLYGDAGRDLLAGGVGDDEMEGGADDDLYEVDSVADKVTERANEGEDTVRASIAYTLADTLENLTLTGAANLIGSGNAADNLLVGNDGANTLNGLAGADTLDGGLGADMLIGGLGDDVYVVDNAGDQVVEAAGEGSDTVRSRISLALSGNVENLTLIGIGSIDGTGNALDNLLVGNAAANTLDGAAGADEMRGGRGNDRYVIDSAGDRVVENSAEGYDTVSVSGLASYALGDNVEALELGAGVSNGIGNALDNLLLGNAAANFLDGGTGADVMMGRGGDDIYAVDNSGDAVIENAGDGIDLVQSSVSLTLAVNVENLRLTGSANIGATGNALANVLAGNAGNNHLDGGAGADTMTGGAGDDTYAVDDGSDIVTELAGDGADTVEASIDHVLADHVENLVLVATAVSGTGNALANRLIGSAADNLLDGGAGIDTMQGGAGNDTYRVDDSGDVVTESAGEGVDLVQSSATFSLGANIENLTLTGTANVDAIGNALANALVGNAGNNRLDGGAGADAMTGGAGNDSYVIDNAGDQVTELLSQGSDRVSSGIDYVLPQHVEQLTLTGTAIRATGNALDNLLFGNDSANVLDGSAGADQMAGGLGDDRYVVENAADVVTEAVSAGSDTIYASVTHGLAGNVENLILTAAAAINATGNDLANVLVGNAGANTLGAGAGNDVLAGGQGNDSLDGGAGDDLVLYHQGEGRDVITDSSGTDTLRFGAGMTIDSLAARNIVVNGQTRTFISLLGVDGQETADGIELVLAAGGIAPIERFEFANGGSAALAQLTIGAVTRSGTGGNDTITGDRSDDTVNAGSGNDVVYGRSGNDVLNGNSGIDKLFGEGGNDRLNGNSEADELWGGAGDDVLDGSSGADLLVGGTGNDQLLGGVDADRLDGGAGDDILDGSSGEDELYAGDGNDTLDAGTDADLLAAGAGNDTIRAGTGQNVVVAGAGDDNVTSGTDNDFVDAGAGNDIVTTSTGSDFIAAGRGNDTIDAGGDEDVIAFNRGDGADTVLTSNAQRDALSLGGGIRYADLALRKVGNDLLLDVGQGDSVTLKDWYLDSRRRNITTLQVVTGTSGGDYDAASTDRMRNRKAVVFNFEQLVNRFDQVRAANPSLVSWPLAGELNAHYTSGSDTQAIGGDLSYRYATAGSYGDLDWRAVRTRVGALNSTALRTLAASTSVDPWTALQAGISLVADQTAGLPSPITPLSAPSADELAFAALTTGRTPRPAWLGATTHTMP